LRVQERWLAAWTADVAQRQGGTGVPVFFADFARYEEQPARLARWWRAHRPDVVLTTFGDAVAWLESGGVDVPGRVSVVHLDRPDDQFAGMSQQWGLIGEAAIDLLSVLLQRNRTGQPESPLTVLVSAQWRDGPTLRAPGTE
jgi:hypothetical protein